MLNNNIVALPYVLVLCAFLIRTSYFDDGSQKLVLELLNDPADDARVATSPDQSIFQAVTFVDFFIQGFKGRIELRVANAAILCVDRVIMGSSVIHFFYLSSSELYTIISI